MARHRILIGTLFSGENEFEQCLEALKGQSFASWEHLVLRDLPNVEAHWRLYSAFMEEASNYDLFIKLDADMVLASPDILAKIVACFASDPDMDHGMFAVRDWYSNRKIMGLHAYSGNARWSFTSDKLFVDGFPNIGGSRRIFWNDPAPVAFHAPDPSLDEAYLFGIHRALKIVQRGRRLKNIGQAQAQFAILNDVWRSFRQTDETRRGIAIVGATEVFEGKHNSALAHKKLESNPLRHHEDVEILTDDLTVRWERKVRLREARWLLLPQFSNFPFKVSKKLGDLSGRKVTRDGSG